MNGSKILNICEGSKGMPPTRDDYRVLQSGIYYDILDIVEAGTEAELRNKAERLKQRLASSMTKDEIAWVLEQRKSTKK